MKPYSTLAQVLKEGEEQLGYTKELDENEVRIVRPDKSVAFRLLRTETKSWEDLVAALFPASQADG